MRHINAKYIFVPIFFSQKKSYLVKYTSIYFKDCRELWPNFVRQTYFPREIIVYANFGGNYLTKTYLCGVAILKECLK